MMYFRICIICVHIHSQIRIHIKTYSSLITRNFPSGQIGCNYSRQGGFGSGARIHWSLAQKKPPYPSILQKVHV